MLLDDWNNHQRSAHPEEGQQPSSGKGKIRKSRRVAVTAISILAGVAGAGTGAAVAMRAHTQHPAPAAATLAPKQHEVVSKPVTPPKTWRLTFDPSFSGTELDANVWGTCYPWASSSGCTNYGNTHDEDQEWYQASQDSFSGGILHLTAQREPTPGLTQSGAPKEYACRSGMITTYPSLRFEYGMVKITVKIPFGNGLWPALWLAAANLKWPPEVDILEHWGTDPNGKSYLHPITGDRQGGYIKTPHLSSGWHTFTLSWTEKKLSLYYDNNKVFSTTTGIPHQPMYLIANLANDKGGVGTCAGSLLIKSIKVWQP